MKEVYAGTQTVTRIATPVDLILAPATTHVDTKNLNMMTLQPSPTVKEDLVANFTSTKDHSPHEGVGWRKKVYQTN